MNIICNKYTQNIINHQEILGSKNNLVLMGQPVMCLSFLPYPTQVKPDTENMYSPVSTSIHETMKMINPQ